MWECRCDGRLKDKDEGTTSLVYTGWSEKFDTILDFVYY